MANSMAQSGILRHIFASIFLFWMSIYLLTWSGSSTLASFFAAVAAGTLAIAYVLYFGIRLGVITPAAAIAGAFIFVARIFIGVSHYLLSIDSSYFSQSTPEFNYIWDFEWLPYLMSKISDGWNDDGFGSLPLELLLTEKNTLLMPYFALLYFLGGNEHFLNISVLNSLHTLLAAIAIAGLWQFRFKTDRTSTIFVIAALQPFGFISSIIWRDSVGQFFFVIGSSLIFTAGFGFFGMLKSAVGAVALMTLRNVYLVIGIIVFVIKHVTGGRRNKLLSFGILAMVYVLLATEGLAIYDATLGRYEGKEFTYSLGFGDIARGVLIGLIGPFPWTQIFDPAVPGREYLLPDILQAIYNLSVFHLIIKEVLSGQLSYSSHPEAEMLALIIGTTALGLFSHGHMSYVSVTTILAVPLVSKLSYVAFSRVFFSYFSAVFASGLAWQFFKI